MLTPYLLTGCISDWDWCLSHAGCAAGYVMRSEMERAERHKPRLDPAHASQSKLDTSVSSGDEAYLRRAKMDTAATGDEAYAKRAKMSSMNVDSGEEAWALRARMSGISVPTATVTPSAPVLTQSRVLLLTVSVCCA